MEAWQQLASSCLSEWRLPGLGPKRLEKLAAVGIETPLALLALLPKTYRDFSQTTKIQHLKPDTLACVVGRLLSLHAGKTYRKRIPMIEGLVDDGSGTVRMIWYGKAYLKDKLVPQQTYRIWGQVKRDKTGMSFMNPKFSDPNADASQVQLELVYRQAGGMSSEMLNQWVRCLLERMEVFPELPEALIKQDAVRNFKTALEIIHQPTALAEETEKPIQLESALEYLKTLEFFAYQTQMRRLIHASQNRSHPQIDIAYDRLTPFFSGLPFEPTNDQSRVIYEIWQGLHRKQRMLALIQGDVGSGKTLVALAAACLFAKAGYQTALMAPTTILARQHYETAITLLQGLGLQVGLLSGDEEPAVNRQTIKALQMGAMDFVVGTHMLFGKRVNFQQLGLVMIDEQHRFGVGQRSALLKKGSAPHYLAFSATPIPRSLALTLYGDFKIFQIREKPAHRKPVKTILKKVKNRDEILQFAKQRVALGEAVFWVLPQIDNEGEENIKSAEAMYRFLIKQGFSKQRLGLAHGRLEKEAIATTMTAFRDGKLDVLVATTVIEVGVDVPRATVIIIDGAQNFGLSQLHQLRGRVGRGDKQAFCFLLVPGDIPSETLKRMRLLEQTDDGFEIAEADLINRGAGHLLGKEQSGKPLFFFGDPWRDRERMLAVSRWFEKEKEEVQ